MDDLCFPFKERAEGSTYFHLGTIRTVQLFAESLESLETQLSQETAVKQGQRLLRVDIPVYCFFMFS